MDQARARQRDFYAGALMAAIGGVTILEASTYDIGSLTEMGPGFLPLALGCVLVLCGAVIAATGGRHPPAGLADAAHMTVPPLDWRGGAAIAVGVASFIVLGDQAGLMPATFACVFIAALGDRTTTLRGAAILAGAVTVLGSLLFVTALKIPFPLLRW